MGNQNEKCLPKSPQTTDNTLAVEQSHVYRKTYNLITQNGAVSLTPRIFECTLFEGFPELALAIHQAMLLQQTGVNSESHVPPHEAGGKAKHTTHSLSHTTPHEAAVKTEGAGQPPTASPEKAITENTFTEVASQISGKHLSQDYFDVYFSMFSTTQTGINDKGCEGLVVSCCKSGLVLCGCSLSEHFRNQSTQPVVQSMMSQATDGVLHKDQLHSWIQKHCSRLLDPLHTFVCQRLQSHNLSQYGAVPVPECITELCSSGCLLSLSTAFLLSCQLSPTYFISSQSGHTDPLSTQCPLPLSSVTQGGWQLLYNSNAQGLSINRFQHHVFQYKGPTVTLMSFEGHVYCLSIEEEWRESTKFWGGSDCCLLQLEPQFKLMQNGSDLVFLNWTQRSLPKGLQIGIQGRSKVLEVDGDFSSVKHYGIELPLHRIEVWGCGGERVLAEQQKQRAWEKKDTQKHKDRKLKIDDWEDSPDRQLLEWGGVKTRHNERM